MVIAEWPTVTTRPVEPKVTVALPRCRPLVQQILHFLVIGVGCTVLTVVVYTLLRTWLSETWSDVLAYAVTTIVSSLANRKITFAEVRNVSRLRLHAQSVLVFLFYCVSTDLALDALDMIVSGPTPAEQALAVWAVSILGGTARFLLLRSWVFRELTSGRSRRASVPQ